jgi:hypothetical protein
MKYIRQLWAVLLFAFIVAALYELFVVRDGYVRIDDPLTRIVNNRGGMTGLLSGINDTQPIVPVVLEEDDLDWADGTKSDDASISTGDDAIVSTGTDTIKKTPRFASLFGKGKEKQDIPADAYTGDVLKNERVETGLLIDEYSNGVLWDDDIAMFVDDRSLQYVVLEYCDHESPLCQDAVQQDMEDVIIEALAGEDKQYDIWYVRKPFVADRAGLWAHIRQAEYCLDESKKNFLHNRIYAMYAESGEVLLEEVYGTYLGLGGEKDRECFLEYTSEFRISQEMRQARDVFGVTRIPSYVVIDPQSWEWVLVPGLYERDEVSELLLK